MSDAYASNESEYWYNVLPQAAMPVAGDIEGAFDVGKVARFLAPAAAGDLTDFRSKLIASLLADPGIFHDLRQLLGVSDKRAYLELSYVASRTAHPTAHTGLCGCHPWTMARHPLEFFIRLASVKSSIETRNTAVAMLADYLLSVGLAEAARGFSGMSHTQLTAVYTALVLPRENQQKSAKRRGHGCEAALASVLHECGVSVVPADKHVNPMGAKDPNLDRETLMVATKQQGKTFSFDMIVLQGALVRVAIQSLIHTSDPGQYGVNKSDETVAVALHVKAANASRGPTAKLELWGLVDGVGFSENKADTINKMLHHFDCFVQLNTLYKAPLRLHQLGLCNVAAIRFLPPYTAEDVAAIAAKYVPAGVRVLGQGEAPDGSWKAIPAGRAVVFLAPLIAG